MMGRFPWSLPILALVATAIGVAYVHSASWSPALGEYLPYGRMQALWTLVALGGFVVAARLPRRWWERYAEVAYVGIVVLLAGLPFVGLLVNGARAWYRFGPVKLQPAELLKVVLVVAIAKSLSSSKGVRSFSGFVKPFGLAALPLSLVLLQPDLGTVLVFFPAIFCMLFVAGARLRYFVIVAVIVMAAAPAVYFLKLKPYQRDRIAVFLDPTLDPMGAGFQAIQSRIAIGAGGAGGAGWGQGSQTQLNYLPDSHTDFIFAVVAEEGGFTVAGGLLLILGLVIVCGLGVAYRARDPFARLVATGICCLFAGQMMVNVGMTMGLMPVTGVTLPFVSYGGSSLLSSYVALGVVCAMAAQPRLSFKDDFS